MRSENNLLKIVNGQVVTPLGILKNATVIVRSGLIEAIAPGIQDAPGVTEIDAKGQYIAPGLIDIQVNGYNSVSFCLDGAVNASASDGNLTFSGVKKVTEDLWKEGVTTYFPTLTTNSQDLLINNFGILAKSMRDPSLMGSIPGFHLPAEILKVFYKTKGAENIVITSDVTSFAGLPVGTYRIKNGQSVEKTVDGNLRFSGQEGGLYGSASPLRNGVAHIMKVTGCGLEKAIQMTTLNPALVHNLKDRGSLAIGKRADLIMFTLEDNKMIIQKTIVAGHTVYSNN